MGEHSWTRPEPPEMQREPSADLAVRHRVVWPGFVLDLERRELLDAAGRPTALRAQALNVLLVLGEHAGHVVGKDDLMRRVWGDVVVTEDSLVQAVGDIRRVLGDSKHERVRTVPRRGYLLAPGIDASTAGPSPASVETPVSMASSTAVPRAGRSQPRCARSGSALARARQAFCCCWWQCCWRWPTATRVARDATAMPQRSIADPAVRQRRRSARLVRRGRGKRLEHVARQLARRDGAGP